MNCKACGAGPMRLAEAHIIVGDTECRRWYCPGPPPGVELGPDELPCVQVCLEPVRVLTIAELRRNSGEETCNREVT